MKRTTPLRTKKPLTRRTPLSADPENVRAWVDGSRRDLPPVNRGRQKRRRAAGLVYGPHHEWMKGRPCVLTGLHRCMGPVTGHHLKSVGSGGEDRNNQVPVCEAAHREFHDRPLSEMCDRYGWDFRSIACEYTARFDRERAA